ncbi:MAG: 6,7-dimethyl-8-ribityllumazine synthase [Puniceicoccaceae bacterium]|nr:6,7-dimethyl-8-ribityllumazine synthase [Puniceicoccaceae bacterium]|tara:strand:+ start:350 stop:835 length:486 start_codon:yes stop_codon:yes gene_type:complete
MSLNPPQPSSDREIVQNNLSIALVVARYNLDRVEELLYHTVEGLKATGHEQPLIARVPGSTELAYATSIIARKQSIDVIIALGVVIAGATEHHSVIAYSNALALNQISLETKIPIINGVIVTATDKEAEERCGPKINRGKEFAQAALEMAEFKNKWTQKTQ